MSSYPPDTVSLVADIGGTNTRVALADGDRLLAGTVRRYSNTGFGGLEEVLQRYLDDKGGVDCAGACVAVAGPVRGGAGMMTNLDWRIDRDALARATRAEKLAIVNDLQAQGHALDLVDEAQVIPVLNPRPGPEDGPRLVIGIGTGFNAALVLETAAGRLVLPSEAGHATLPVRDAEELRLSRFIEAEHGVPGVEDALSGRGLERIFRWLATEGGGSGGISAAEIMKAVEAGSDPRAERAAAAFVRLLGTVAGNLALVQLPFGGIYLVGGVARAFRPHLDRLGFAAAFADKGRFAAFMGSFPVSVIEDDFAALRGCARYLAALP